MIPYDSLCLAVALAELRPFVGARVQKIVQPSDRDVLLELYGGAGEATWLFSCHPEHFRAHLVTRRPPAPPQPPAFCAALRARIGDSRLVSASQRGFDRIAVLVFERGGERHSLIAELMGKHSNLILVDEEDRIVSAAHFVPPRHSIRPIQGGAPYVPPPFEPRPSLLGASAIDDLKVFEGASPFLLKWIDAQPDKASALATIKRAANGEGLTPVLAEGQGSYPLSVIALGFAEKSKPSLSAALETWWGAEIARRAREELRASLLSRLRHVRFARELALNDVESVLTQGGAAARLQRWAELLQAYVSQVPEGAEEFETFDYDGRPIVIPLKTDLDAMGNAQRYFDKAHHSKAMLPSMRERRELLREDMERLDGAIAFVEGATQIGELRTVLEAAQKSRWVIQPIVKERRKHAAPAFEGHKIRELLGPHGFLVLFGENATANDYLTTRLAKPSDWWLHVRGGTSSHVIVRAANRPEAVPRDTLEFAAQIAVANSPQRHSGYVAVDYTLRKYVRKPKGAPPGTALYTHEKTLHVEKA